MRSEERELGMLSIGTDQTKEFTPQELRTFQIVCEFLTVTSIAEALQSERDYVQQGRAALLEAVTDGVIMTQPDPQATILTTNQRFRELFNLGEKSPEGKSLWELLNNDMSLPQPTRRQLRQKWERINDNDPDTVSGEFNMPGPRGTPLEIQWYNAPVYRGGVLLGRIYTFHDITPERAGEKLRAELLSRISHELRTPLTSVRGFAEFILESEKDGPKLPDQAREYVEIIFKSAVHLSRLISDIMEITRASAGALELHITDATIQDIIIENVARAELQLKEKNQNIVMDLDDDLPPLAVDVERIGQVITNLVNNAIKYTPEDSTVRIESTRIDRARDLPKDAPAEILTPCVLVGVHDNGKGLDHHDVEQIFMPFYRTRAARAGKIEGSGLGLAVSRSIIELHRGRIWAEAATRRNPGGHFYFTLPIEDDAR
jgi:signal transduction histidine kinase